MASGAVSVARHEPVTGLPLHGAPVPMLTGWCYRFQANAWATRTSTTWGLRVI